MRKIAIIILVILCGYTIAYGDEDIVIQPNDVLILEPVGNASAEQKNIIKAAIEKTLNESYDYKAITRVTADQVVKSFNLQKGEMLSEEQRKRLAATSNATLLCFTTANDTTDNRCFVKTSFVKIGSGTTSKTTDALIESTSLTKLQEGCVHLATDLIWEPYLSHKLEIPPQYPGGVEALQRHIMSEVETEKVPAGTRIFVKFIVERSGSLTDIAVLRDGGYPKLGKRVAEALEKGGKWLPGELNGRKVQAASVIPVIITKEK